MKNQTLQHQFKLWTVILVVIPSLLIMVIYSLEQIKAAKQKQLEAIEQRVAFQKRIIDYWMAERAGNVRELSQAAAFQNLDEEQMKRALYVKLEHDNNFDSLSYIDKNGYFKNSTLSRGIQHPSVIGKPYFQAAQKGNEYISDVVIGRNSGLPIVNFSSPIFDKAGNFQGLILGSVRITTLQTLLRENWFGETGEIHLVNREGMLLNEPRYVDQLIEQGFIEDTAIMKVKMSKDALRNIRLGETGIATWTNYRGQKVFGAYQYTPAQGWTLIGKINESEVLAPIYKQLGMMAGGTVFFIILILPLATLLTNRIKRPIEWLIEQSNLVAAADYTMVGQEECTGKIPYELVTLCKTFVHMNHKIKNTVGLLQDNEAKLESQVLEIQDVNARLEKEITERQAIQRILENQIVREKMVAAFSAQLANSTTNDLAHCIKQLLVDCGRLFKVNMCFAYLSSEKEGEFRLKYYWQSENERWNKKNSITRLAFEKFPWLIQQLKESGQVSIDADDLPQDAAAEAQIITDAQLKSIFLVPMLRGSDLMGFLGIATRGEKANWQEEQTVLLKVTGELILSAVERHRIFHALRNSETDNRALVEAIPDGLLRISAAGKVLSAKINKKIASVFTEDQLVGLNFASVIPNQIAELFSAAIARALAKGELQKFEYDIVGDGNTQYREARIVPTRDHTVVAVIRDMTEQKKAAEALANLREAMVNAQHMALLGVMTGSIAHEMKQPLNSIKVSASGILYLMKTGAKLSTIDYQRELSRIVNETERIDHIIRKTLAIVREGVSYQEPLRIDEILLSVFTLIKDQELFKNIKINFQFPTEQAWITGNQAQIDQVLLHLLSNAGQALQEKGLQEKHIHISIQVTDQVIISIADNGPGLDPAALDKIFEPFFTTGRTKHNMGLGLPIVKFIIYAHGGEITAENNQNGGATFRVSFPLLRHLSGSEEEAG